MLRVALAEERTGATLKNTFGPDAKAGETQDVIRERKRWRYPFTGYFIDLTVVNGKEYSIELEFSHAFLKGVPQSVLDSKDQSIKSFLMPPIKFLLHNTFPELSMIQGLPDLASKYHALLRGYRDDQPKNIEESQVAKLADNYAFTNKLNGTRYRLMLDMIKYRNIPIPMVFLVSVETFAS